MKLYCFYCNDLHEYTKEEAERIIYALVGLVADMSLEKLELAPDASPAIGPPCLTADTLRSSYDADEYYEHVEQGIECRQTLEAST